MKKWLICLPVILFPFITLSQFKWDGEAMNNRWDDPLNWAGDMVPGPGAEVILDHSIRIGSYTVELPSGDQTVDLSRLVLSPEATDSIQLVLPSTNTAQIGLLITGQGNALVIGKNAVFVNASGASSGTPVQVSGDGFFRIENGGRYVHQTERGHTTGLVSRLAGDAGTESGVFEFRVPGGAAYTVSVSGRTYGHLIFSSGTAGIIKTYTGAGVNPLTVQSNLHIKENAIFSYGNNVSNIFIGGDCVIDSGGQFTLSNGANSSTIHIKGDLHVAGRLVQSGSAAGSVVKMDGAGNSQKISGRGIWLGNYSLSIGNPGAVVVNDTTWLPGDLHILSGKVNVGERALLGIAAGKSISLAGDQNFVEGSLARVGSDTLLFPLGTGGIYAPLSIAAGGAVLDTFIARYYRANPQTASLASDVLPPVNHISSVEYWSLISSNNSPRNVSLFAGATSFVRDPASVVVAAVEDNFWLSKGLAGFEAVANNPPWVSGFVHAEFPSQEYSWFTLASTGPESANPLPVRILSYTARLDNAGRVNISWELSEDVPAGTRFRLVRETASGSLVVWDTVFLQGTANRVYAFADRLREPGNYHYRMEIDDPAIGNTISAVRSVTWMPKDGNFISVYPNPASGRAWLRWYSGESPFYIVIYNSLGRQVMIQKRIGINAVKEYELNVSSLPPGLYRIVLLRGNIPLAAATLLVRR